MAKDKKGSSPDNFITFTPDDVVEKYFEGYSTIRIHPEWYRVVGKDATSTRLEISDRAGNIVTISLSNGSQSLKRLLECDPREESELSIEITELGLLKALITKIQSLENNNG